MSEKSLEGLKHTQKEIKSTSPAMNRWQVERLVAQLMLVSEHASDSTCPCQFSYYSIGEEYQSESCIPKHLLLIEAYCIETIPMVTDEGLKGILNTTAEEAREIKEAEIRKACNEEVEQIDITEWSRSKRKLLEPYIYQFACAVPEGEKTGTLDCCTYRMKPTGEVLLTCRKNGGVLEGLYPTLEDAKKEAAQFCGTAPVDDAVVSQVVKMFSEEGEMVILQEPIAALAEDYVLFKRYHPRTGITEMIVTFAFPKGIGTLPFIEDISKEDQKGILATIASLAKEIGYEMRPETDRMGQFRVRRELNTVVFNLADWIGLTAKGEPFLMPDGVLKQALKESFTFGFDYKGKAVSMPAGGMIEKPKITGELPKVKYVIKQTCTGTPPICTFEIVRKAETTEIDIAKDEPELLAKLPSIIRPDTVVKEAKVSEGVARMFEKTGCPCKIGIEPEKMSVQAIQDELNALLFDEETQKACDAKDRELLTIVIAQPKAHHFDFLTGKTEWKVRGKWKRPDEGFDIEANVQLDVEFKDAADESVGKRIIELLKAYNTKVVGETILYARIIPIEEGTLTEQSVYIGLGRKVPAYLQKERAIYPNLLWAHESTESRIKILKESKLLWEPYFAYPWAKLPFEYRKTIADYYLRKKGSKSEKAPLQQSTLSAIGSAAITGVGIGAGFKFVDWLAKKFGKKELGEGEMGAKLPYVRELPIYVEVFKTTIEKHYHPTMEECQEGSIRVVKPEKDILVYLCCKVGDDWNLDTFTCLPNPSVHKTITPNTKKYRDELDHLKLVHPEVKINYRTGEVGVEPVVAEGEQELEAVGEALEHAEEVG